VLEYPPEEYLGHVGRSDLVGVGKVVAGGRRRASDAGERARIQVQGITDVVESDTMSQLRVTQTDNMTQRTKGSGLFIDFGLPSYLGNQEFGNEVANLAQQIHFRSRWNVVVFIFHPCRVAGRNEMFQLFLKILWDGCDLDCCWENIHPERRVPPETAEIGVTARHGRLPLFLLENIKPLPWLRGHHIGHGNAEASVCAWRIRRNRRPFAHWQEKISAH